MGGYVIIIVIVVVIVELIRGSNSLGNRTTNHLVAWRLGLFEVLLKVMLSDHFCCSPGIVVVAMSMEWVGDGIFPVEKTECGC